MFVLNEKHAYVISALAFIAVAANYGHGRVIPGGPWIHLGTDVVPFVSFIAVICIMSFMKTSVYSSRIVLGMMAISLAIMWALAMREAIPFWFNPVARGDIFGW